ncbi:hypothetical protein JX265_007398 [Neoarthrinium moseri]|uniref:Uncharacterized protein n=1 Tax=Neoarthrinium moseri TaxID=1658444 RepID=A0A9P9WK54_9PEZI|nr:uncharacterized protein JN550_009121 [Neoarthrinium moseri]KAI1843612.1 hypothetical protein JX266_010245 [Neoarthrinium moseri]KAI1864101.1 hypothetical protein JN550_009121 [Neoarthrinium moseri]KAI1867596.1 hypothetical protein JX265_007398 [Neoarthrinium moseri]
MSPLIGDFWLALNLGRFISPQHQTTAGEAGEITTEAARRVPRAWVRGSAADFMDGGCGIEQREPVKLWWIRWPSGRIDDST